MLPFSLLESKDGGGAVLKETLEITGQIKIEGIVKDNFAFEKRKWHQPIIALHLSLAKNMEGG